MVPASYAQGDHIKCGTCATKHKVVRGDVLRLVIADVGPLKEALFDNRRVVERLEDELRGARRSFGIGANGLGIGVAYVVYQVGLNEQALGQPLLLAAVGVALATGILLEAMNYLFLAKRQRIRRLSAELDEARSNGRQIDKLIREASRV
ncbi:MAG TPA: hypothetical protein VFO85_01345 [Vicinamibacteria bacterium]|nr:hypothetical protein [Vicinamibacteria bacterium]